MSRDPRNYKNPDAFDPERFLGSEPELDPRKYVFGYGKRFCAGLSSPVFFITCFSGQGSLRHRFAEEIHL